MKWNHSKLTLTIRLALLPTWLALAMTAFAQERWGLGSRGEIYRPRTTAPLEPTFEATVRLIQKSKTSLEMLGTPGVDERCRSFSFSGEPSSIGPARVVVACSGRTWLVHPRFAGNGARDRLLGILLAIQDSSELGDFGIRAALAPFADALWVGQEQGLPVGIELAGMDANAGSCVAMLDARSAYRFACIIEDVALAESFLPAAARDSRVHWTSRESADIERDLCEVRETLTQNLRAPARPAAAASRSMLLLSAALATMTSNMDPYAPYCSSGELEIEANSTKYEATPISCLVAGNFLTGTTTGAVVSPGYSGTDSADYFRIQICPTLPGVYAHQLTIVTSGASGHTGSIRGLTQTNGLINTGTDATLQTSSAATNPPRMNQWYGFGKGEELYYRIVGTSSTTAPYEVRLTSTQVVPTVIPSGFFPGSITISTVGLGHNTDTEITVLDHLFDPIPGFHNDDEGPAGPTLQSTLTRTFAPGTYYIAVSNYNTCTDLSDANSDEDFQSGVVLDLPGSVVNSSPATNLPLDFYVYDGIQFQTVSASKSQPFEVLFFELQVGQQTGALYCFGDGSGTACPCGNSSAVGANEGCLNSFGTGGKLVGTGNASLSNDTLVLTGSQMPNSSALYFQGTIQQNGGAGSVFGDGLRCAGGTIVRLVTKSNLGGASQYPEPGDASVSTRGLVTAPGVRTYQVWYRNAASFCTFSLFNLTNGLTVQWGP